MAEKQHSTKKIFVREISSRFEGQPAVFSSGSLFFGAPQILIPRNTPLTDAELKFACAHEFGHIAEGHSLYLTALAMTNAALLALPLVPLHSVFFAVTASAVGFIPLFRHFEKRADDFAFRYCSKDILRQSYQAELLRAQERPKHTGWFHQALAYLFSNDERRNRIYQRLLVGESASSQRAP